MTKTEMLEILRGKKLLKAPENNDELIEGLKMLDTIFGEIADELEQSERVVHGHWQFKDDFGNRDFDFVAVCSRCGNKKNASGYSHSEWRSEWRYCNACGAQLDEVSE